MNWNRWVIPSTVALGVLSFAIGGGLYGRGLAVGLALGLWYGWVWGKS